MSVNTFILEIKDGIFKAYDMVNGSILETDICTQVTYKGKRHTVFKTCNISFKMAQLNLLIFGIHIISVNDYYFDIMNCRIERRGSKQFLFIMLTIKQIEKYIYIHVYKICTCSFTIRCRVTYRSSASTDSGLLFHQEIDKRMHVRVIWGVPIK